MDFTSFLKKLPSIAAPEGRLGFREKLKWTGIALVVFYILGQVTLFGLNASQGNSLFGELQVILASNFGTLVTLGIGPIVLASIIIQLLNGAGVVKFDMRSPEGKAVYMGAQKLLAIFFTIFEGGILIASGQLAPDAALIASFGAGTIGFFVLLQILIGGIIIIYLDEIVSKWGFGSGISLFIAAGVGSEIVWRAFSPMIDIGGKAAWFGQGPLIGAIPNFFKNFEFIRAAAGGVSSNDMLAVAATLVVFVVAMYAQSIKVEVPITYGRVAGLGRRYPLPFVYASNMPVIFITALIANLRFLIAILHNAGITFLGTFDAVGNASGFIKYVLPYNSFAKDVALGLGADYLHAFTYFIVLVVGSILFSKLWVGVSGTDAGSLADKLAASGMQIPGFRSDPRIIEKVLDRYIPGLTVLGGAFVGAIAALGDFTGALGSGTGILLTVGIIYQLYREIASQQLLELHPALRNFIGEGGVI